MGTKKKIQAKKAKKKGIPNAAACHGYTCSREHQLCPKGSPGASSSNYCCFSKKWVKTTAKSCSKKAAKAAAKAGKRLINKGASGCKPSKKCGRCTGDCDSDKDCKAGLKCFQ